MKGLAVGRTVHYVAPGSADGTYPSEHRAAIVTRVDSKEHGLVSLAVLNPTGIHFVENLPHDPDGEAYTWHWPEYVD